MNTYHVASKQTIRSYTGAGNSHGHERSGSIGAGGYSIDVGVSIFSSQASDHCTAVFLDLLRACIHVRTELIPRVWREIALRFPMTVASTANEYSGGLSVVEDEHVKAEPSTAISGSSLMSKIFGGSSEKETINVPKAAGKQSLSKLFGMYGTVVGV